jgi:hypothetical protein
MMQRKLFILFLIITLSKVFGQNAYYGTTPHNWSEKNLAWAVKNVSKDDKEDVICLAENTEFSFYSTTDQKIVKNAVYKINTAAGLEKFKTYMPESFDVAFDEG